MADPPDQQMTTEPVTDDGDSNFEDAEEDIEVELDPQALAELTEAYFDAEDEYIDIEEGEDGTLDSDDDEDDDDEDDDDEDDEIDLDEDEEEGGDDNDASGITAGDTHILSRRATMALLARLQNGLFSSSDNDLLPGRRRRPPAFVRKIQEEPEQTGVELTNSGEFMYPSPSHKIHSSRRFPYSVRTKLLQREILPYQRSKCVTADHFLPTSNGRLAVQYPARAYSGQFSQDGSFFYTCSQDFRVRLYDTTDPTRWNHYKTVIGSTGRWTITDANLTPDNRFVAYSSITPIVYMAHTEQDNTEEQEVLDFHSNGNMGYNNGIWSIRFSADGREIVAGAGDAKMYVYDVEMKQVVLGVHGHSNDVNAVCFADQSSNVLFSGSDDCLIKVWDRRSMVNHKEAGVFVGHTEGITFISSKGDGRYVISNGKDQTTKLWDIRRLVSVEKWDASHQVDYTSNFDYRHMEYPGPRVPRHPDDCSVMTYTGHAILKTLIRCGFSPAATTGQGYIYSGSDCGKVWIWNLDGTVNRTLDLTKAAKVDPKAYGGAGGGRGGGGGGGGGRRRFIGFGSHERACIRDAAWHPTLPYLASTSWHSEMDAGSIYLHEFGEERGGGGGGQGTSRQSDGAASQDFMDDEADFSWLGDEGQYETGSVLRSGIREPSYRQSDFWM